VLAQELRYVTIAGFVEAHELRAAARADGRQDGANEGPRSSGNPDD
jgi:hypothetical protein